MEVIPVIDILDGEVVQAIKGERKRYKPIKSLLISSSKPLEVAGVFKEQFGLNKIYIADLNSILKKGNNFRLIRDIRNRLNLGIFLDYGIRTAEDLKQEISTIVDYLIFGTETLTSIKVLETAIKKTGINKIFVSIDMKGRNLISKFKQFKEPINAIVEFAKIGIGNFILLDLKNVGTMGGYSEVLKDIILKINRMNLCLVVGGGIRTREDIMSLKHLNVNAVLIATALHQKKITKQDIVKIGTY